MRYDEVNIEPETGLGSISAADVYWFLTGGHPVWAESGEHDEYDDEEKDAISRIIESHMPPHWLRDGDVYVRYDEVLTWCHSDVDLVAWVIDSRDGFDPRFLYRCLDVS